MKFLILLGLIGLVAAKPAIKVDTARLDQLPGKIAHAALEREEASDHGRKLFSAKKIDGCDDCTACMDCSMCFFALVDPDPTCVAKRSMLNGASLQCQKCKTQCPSNYVTPGNKYKGCSACASCHTICPTATYEACESCTNCSACAWCFFK